MNNRSLDQLLEDLKQDAVNQEQIRHLGADARLSPFLAGTIDKTDEPADASYKAVLKNSHGRPVGFLICSNPVNTELVARNTAMARKAKRRLPSPLNSVILEPLLEGRYKELSWAVFDLKKTLADDLWRWRWQKIRITPALMQWLAAKAQSTRLPVGDFHLAGAVAGPLQALADDARFPGEIRARTRKALERLAKGAWAPQWILAHNDLWKGNILLPRPGISAIQPRFYIIDWAGSTTRGFPFFDLLKLIENFNLPDFYALRLVKKHCSIMDCSILDSMSYLLAGIAGMGMNLENFPHHVYVKMSVGLYRRLARILGEGEG